MGLYILGDTVQHKLTKNFGTFTGKWTPLVHNHLALSRVFEFEFIDSLIVKSHRKYKDLGG